MKKTNIQPIDVVLNQLHARNGAMSEGEAARLMNRSERRFRYEFTRINGGTNFRTARVTAKLDRAEWLLRETNLGIPEISTTLGYSDRTKFERTFKRFRGITPAQFRALRPFVPAAPEKFLHS